MYLKIADNLRDDCCKKKISDDGNSVAVRNTIVIADSSISIFLLNSLKSWNSHHFMSALPHACTISK
jgi:hypothetical protein